LFANRCYFKTSAGFLDVSQANHYTGFLSVSTPGPKCLKWAQPIGSGANPSYASPRLVSYSGLSVLLVSESHPLLNEGGILHAYAAGNGTELWSYATRDVSGESTWGLFGVVPAQMPALSGFPSVLLLAYGPRIVAIDMNACSGTTCPEAGAWDSQDGELPFFVSSVALRPDGSALYVHDSLGFLWKVGVACSTAGGGAVQVAFSLLWACAYSVEDPQVCTPKGALRSSSSSSGSGSVPPPSQAFPGGWYQPSTRAQVEELHAAIAALHGSVLGWEAGQPRSPRERSSAQDLMGRLAREVPRAALLGIVTESGYARLCANGKPCLKGLDDPNFSILPFATPALYWDYVRCVLKLPRTASHLHPL